MLGSVLANRKRSGKLVISEIEPLSVFFSSEILEKYGFKVVKIPVDEEGFVDLEKLANAVDRETILVRAFCNRFSSIKLLSGLHLDHSKC